MRQTWRTFFIKEELTPSTFSVQTNGKYTHFWGIIQEDFMFLLKWKIGLKAKARIIYALARKNGVPVSTILALEKGGKRLNTINKLLGALGYCIVIEKLIKPFKKQRL